jgi:hypothetical protein
MSFPMASCLVVPWVASRNDRTQAPKSQKRGVSRRASQNKTPETNVGIPTFIPDPVETWKTRFYPPSSGSDVVSVTVELPIAPYGIADTATSLLVPFKAVRLSKVEMWCNYRPEKDIAGNTINLTFVQRRTVKPIEWSDTATFNRAAHIVRNINKYEPMGLWYLTGSGETNPELRFQLPQGAVLELTFNYILQDSSPVGVASGSGLSYPRVYSNQLDTALHVIGRTDYTVIPM